LKNNQEAEEIGLYVQLAMKNLYFMNLQIENVTSEVQRLLKHLDIGEVKSELEKKSKQGKK
jgi:hypothetical protein